MPIQEKMVFIVGCPRSGTTWLQLLLYQHPSIASSCETHLFSRYLSPLEAFWNREKTAIIQRKDGLSGVVSQAEFDDMLRSFASFTFHKIRESKPTATVVVEKTPDHIRDWDLILRLFPNAYFLHVIRDPRSVVCSLRSASRSWGSYWAPSSIIVGARKWCSAIEAGRCIALVTDRYKEVCYEKLLIDGQFELQEVVTWLGLEAEAEFCKQAVDSCNISNLKAGTQEALAPWALSQEPSGFFRRGRADAWRHELSGKEISVVEYITGNLMDELNYHRATSVSRIKPARLIFNEMADKGLNGLVGTISSKWPWFFRTLGHRVRNPGKVN